MSIPVKTTVSFIKCIGYVAKVTQGQRVLAIAVGAMKTSAMHKVQCSLQHKDQATLPPALRNGAAFKRAGL